MTVIANPVATQASIPFYNPPANGEPPYQKVVNDPVTGVRERNYTFVSHQITVENLRGKEDTVSLDTAGFQLYSNRPSAHKSFANDEEIKKEYYPECIALLKELTGASRVVIFDHTIRRRRPGEIEAPNKRQPVSAAHIDQTPKSLIERIHHHLPAEDVPEVLKHRYQIINLWRPINHKAIDWPLALCDFRSVDQQEDAVPIAHVYPDRVGETYGVKYSPEQRWKYWYGMNTDEFVLIKCADSIQDGSVAIFTPHTGFEDPTTPPGTPLRESIEIRALVFYDN